MSRRKDVLYQQECSSFSNHFTYETDVINPLTFIFTFNECDSLSLKNAHALLYNLGYTCARILYRIVQYSMFKNSNRQQNYLYQTLTQKRAKYALRSIKICGIYNREEMNFKYTRETARNYISKSFLKNNLEKSKQNWVAQVE